jgi:Holliday junction resolvasome RuvABC DNA-binding subunit
MQLSGIGKKRAQQIIFDLRERLKNTFEIVPSEKSSAYSMAVSALEKLGFSGFESREAVDRVLASQEESPDVAHIIGEALKQLSTGL